MKLKDPRSRTWRQVHSGILAICCALALVPVGGALLAQGQTQPPPAPTGTAEPAATKLPPEQLDSLVAPIALYPDPLLAQVLAASTYPLEIIQLQQWLAKNPNLKDQALVDAVAKQPWDPSVQSMAAVPDVVKRLADDIQWTTDLGNAVLAQQGDVMDSVQRMRKKAKDKGALETNEQQKVETQVVETKEVIVIEAANPEVIYVPSYSPTVVYGPPVYPYPPIYYPPYPPGAAFVSFSFGVMWGAAWGGSCCGCGWGGNDIDINVDNNFNRNNVDIGGGGRGGDRGGNNWQHNSQHRGGAPYADKATANKYGGTARGDSMQSRQANARQQQARGSTGASNRASTGASASNRAGTGASPGAGNRSGTGSSRAPSASTSGRSGTGSSRAPSASASSRGGGFGGSGGYSGSRARASSSRGSSSFGGRGGGGRGGRR
jgi:hypothetical protein